MTVDPFTAASPVYRDAMRRPHKSGSAFQTFPPRSRGLGQGLYLLTEVGKALFLWLVLFLLLCAGSSAVYAVAGGR